MITIGFWNTHHNMRINEAIADIVEENAIDIMAVSEYSANSNDLITKQFHAEHSFSSIAGISKVPDLNVFYSETHLALQEIFAEQDRYCIYSFLNEGKSFLFCVLHMPSKLYGDNRDDVEDYAEDVIYDIIRAEETVKSQRTIVVGDFNVDPFERPLLQARMFHSYQDKRDSLKRKKINNKERIPFYNPMWNLYGDDNQPPGTYFYYKPGREPLWRMFDQALMRYEVAQNYIKGSLKILTETRRFDFRTRAGRPNKNKFSDHFPFVFSIGRV